ncbi:MAG: helix-turn-helix domain-containing protein [Erysipelotrichaceae bacterium]|nr:helix-turn-helix domain-containing protein [Erysipelotrichaceae bacterium]
MIIRKHTEIGGGIMSNIDKTEFGSFLYELRKGKGLTQKELAEKLLVSSKAISKWETGANMPDVSLLIPLADILDVTVTELLQCKKSIQQELNTEDVETLVKQAITLKETETQTNRSTKRKRILFFIICLLISIAETVLMFLVDDNSLQLYLFLPLIIASFVFSSYFTFIVRDHLPAYYDENHINFYSDGFFRMNMPGIHFNNSNWPHISNYLRIWSCILLLLTPVLVFLFNMVIPIEFSGYLISFLLLGTLLIPAYLIGKKYE